MSQAQGRKVAITGATRGLGRALTERLIASGATIAGCGRDAEAIAELSREHQEPHDFQVVDVSDDARVRAWSRLVLNRLGTPDLLICNAALINPNGKLWTIAAEDFDLVVDVNIKGVANVIRHLVPAMVENRSGVIVALSSGWGRSVAPDVAPYCATKWAIEGLAKALAQELPAGMASIPLNPGIIDTGMLRSCLGETAGRYPTPQEWAAAAADYVLQLGPKDNGKSLSVPSR